MTTGPMIWGREDGRKFLIKQAGPDSRWWYVFDLETRECLSGGFPARSQALEHAKSDDLADRGAQC